jgi:hypothetical protein
MLLDTFDRVRIINLKHRQDRRREMTAELARLGLAPGGQIDFHEAFRPEDAGGFPSIGARGCFGSHLSILQEARADGVQRLLILEDDLDFAPDVETLMPRALGALAAQPWSIFYAGYERYAGQPEQGPIHDAAPEQRIRTTHFLAFSAPAIALAVPYLEHMLTREPGDPAGGPMHVDGAYSWLRRDHPELSTWLALPELGHQRPSRTDIHDLKLIDRTPLLREAAALLRRIRRNIG